MKRREQLLKHKDKADEFCRLYLKRQAVRAWKEHMRNVQMKKALADIHHRTACKRYAIKTWKASTEESIYEYTLKVSQASVHYLHKVCRIQNQQFQLKIEAAM